MLSSNFVSFITSMMSHMYSLTKNPTPPGGWMNRHHRRCQRVVAKSAERREPQGLGSRPGPKAVEQQGPQRPKKAEQWRPQRAKAAEQQEPQRPKKAEQQGCHGGMYGNSRVVR